MTRLVTSGKLLGAMLFTIWPKEEEGEQKDKIVIGIVGKDPFGARFKDVEGREVNGKTLAIQLNPLVPRG